MTVVWKKLAIPSAILMGLKIFFATCTFDGTYTAGGYAFTAGTLPTTVLGMVCIGSTHPLKTFAWDRTNSKVRIHTGGTEETGSVASHTAVFLVLGF